MKPLDLSKPIQTRDGRKVRVLATDIKGLRPVVCVLASFNEHLDDSIVTYPITGKYYSDKDTHALDLIPIPPKPVTIERWVNVFPNGLGCVFNSKARADESPYSRNRIACVKLTGQYTPE